MSFYLNIPNMDVRNHKLKLDENIKNYTFF